MCSVPKSVDALAGGLSPNEANRDGVWTQEKTQPRMKKDVGKRGRIEEVQPQMTQINADELKKFVK
jgi:hypothetical protein